MNPQPVNVRRQTLQLRCAEQRMQFAYAAEAVQSRLRGIDRGINAVRSFRVGTKLLALVPMILAVMPMFRRFGRFGRFLTVVNTIRRLLPRR